MFDNFNVSILISDFEYTEMINNNAIIIKYLYDLRMNTIYSENRIERKQPSKISNDDNSITVSRCTVSFSNSEII